MKSSAAFLQLQALVLSHRSGALPAAQLQSFAEELQAYLELERLRFERHAQKFVDAETATAFLRLCGALRGYAEVAAELRQSQDWTGQDWCELLAEAAALDRELEASCEFLRN